MTGFSCRIDFRLIMHPVKSMLSLSHFPTQEAVTPAKVVINPIEDRGRRMLPGQHLDKLMEKPTGSTGVTGVRNVITNLRGIATGEQACAPFGKPNGTIACVSEEQPTCRPYHAFRCTGSHFFLDEFIPGEPVDGVRWLITGVPVLWDNCCSEELYSRMITEAADHSHVWRLPRGKHPATTSETTELWGALHAEFEATLTATREEATERLLRKAGKLLQENRILDYFRTACEINIDGPKASELFRQAESPFREDRYLHTVLGINPDKPDEVILIIAHGRLEDLGKKAQQLGAQRAICVENGGSCAFYHMTESNDWRPLVSAPNLRPDGHAFVFFQLADSAYSTLP